MKVLRIALVAVALLAVGLKLFTYEYFYVDDPTSGIALRAVPGLQSQRRLQSGADLGRDHILIVDENDFFGSGVYRTIVQGGWLGLSALATVLLVVARRRGGGAGTAAVWCSTAEV